MDHPPSTIHAINQLRATQQLRSHAAHYSSHPYGQYGSSGNQSSSHYHPYSRHNSYRHPGQGQGRGHDHDHSAQYIPSNAVNAYPSHPSAPCPTVPGDYSGYNEGVSHGMSWTRTGSFSPYGSYSQDEVSPSHYAQQPASFLLPGSDPMASNGASCGMSMYPNGRSNSQSQIWGDSTQNIPSAGSAGYGDNVPDANGYDTALSGSGAMSRQAMAPYQINTSSLSTNGTHDRILPTPGGRHYSASFTGTSTLESLPLSAVSHRSSIGWSTDSASSASHVSSQTSVTESNTGQEYTGQRSSIHRPSDSQDMAYHGLGFNYSPQQTNLPGSALPTNSEDISCSNGSNDIYAHSKSGSSRSMENGDRGTNSTTELPSHHQRCRTLSQSTTPIVSHLPHSTNNTSMHHLHRSHDGNIPSHNHDADIDDVPNPSTSSSSLLATPHVNTATAPNFSPPYRPNPTSAISSCSTATSLYSFSRSANAPSSTMTGSTTVGLYGYTAPPSSAATASCAAVAATTAVVTRGSSGGSSGCSSSSVTPSNSSSSSSSTPLTGPGPGVGVAVQSQTCGSLGGSASSGGADGAVLSNSLGGGGGHGLRAGMGHQRGGLGLGSAGRVGMGFAHGFAAGAGPVREVSADLAGEEYSRQVAGDVAADGSARSNVGSLGALQANY